MKLNTEIKTATSGFYTKILDILQMQTDAQKNIIQPYNANLNTNININLNTDINLERSSNNHSSTSNSSNSSIDFRYICIKKDHFDVDMIYLKYINLKKENYIEIIYKSPSIFLDGLFLRHHNLVQNNYLFLQKIVCHILAP